MTVMPAVNDPNHCGLPEKQRIVNAHRRMPDYLADQKMITERLNLIRWIPRVLNLMLAFFLTLVGHDIALEAGKNPEDIPGIAMLTPAVLMMIVLTLAWTRPRLAALMLMTLAVAWMVTFSAHLELAMSVSVPLAVNALLYWLGSGYIRAED